MDKAKSWRRQGRSRPFVLGHRGARHAAPENTLAAFALAADEGADGVELDVRLDGSGNVVVAHDVTLARVSKDRDPRRIESLQREELARIDLGGGERVPSLTDVLALARERALRVNIELKHDVRSRRRLFEGVKALVARERGAADWLLLSSFYPPFVVSLARALPDVPVAWLVHHKQRVLRYAPAWQLLGAVGVHPEHMLVTRARLERLRRHGALVNVWTVNDPTRAAELAELGVDAIISDTPGAVLERLRRADSAA